MSSQNSPLCLAITVTNKQLPHTSDFNLINSGALSADLVRQECPRPTAKSHSWQMEAAEAAEPSPI